MRLSWLGMFVLVLVGGCRSVGLPVLRTNFPGESRIEAECIEYKNDPDIIAEGVSAEYQAGWRIAYVSESTISFLMFSSPHVRICYERLLSLANQQHPPAGSGNERVNLPSSQQPSRAAPPPVMMSPEEIRTRSKEQLEQALAARQSLLAACRNTYGKDVSSVTAKVTMNAAGEIEAPQIEAATSSLANCVARVLKTITLPNSGLGSATIDLEIKLRQ